MGDKKKQNKVEEKDFDLDSLSEINDINFDASFAKKIEKHTDLDINNNTNWEEGIKNMINKDDTNNSIIDLTNRDLLITTNIEIDSNTKGNKVDNQINLGLDEIKESLVNNDDVTSIQNHVGNELNETHDKLDNKTKSIYDEIKNSLDNHDNRNLDEINESLDNDISPVLKYDDSSLGEINDSLDNHIDSNLDVIKESIESQKEIAPEQIHDKSSIEKNEVSTDKIGETALDIDSVDNKFEKFKDPFSERNEINSSDSTRLDEKKEKLFKEDSSSLLPKMSDQSTLDESMTTIRTNEAKESTKSDLNSLLYFLANRPNQTKIEFEIPHLDKKSLSKIGLHDSVNINIPSKVNGMLKFGKQNIARIMISNLNNKNLTIEIIELML